MNKLIGIAGGSGSGKSTLAIALCRKYPNTFALVHIDDYFKKSADAPRKGKFINWDHPDCLRFDDLHEDLQKLIRGESIFVNTKSELYHPDYDPKSRIRISHEIQPKPIVLLEGYFALYDERILRLIDFKIFLTMPIEQSMRRRSVNKSVHNTAYLSEVLAPAHSEFVEPTRNHADLDIDVTVCSPTEVFSEVEDALIQKGLLKK